MWKSSNISIFSQLVLRADNGLLLLFIIHKKMRVTDFVPDVKFVEKYLYFKTLGQETLNSKTQ